MLSIVGLEGWLRLMRMLWTVTTFPGEETTVY